MEPAFTLNTGAKIPALGFGTWQSKDEMYKAVLTALEIGYGHIDTAFVYQTEKAVGQALRDSGVPREEVFVTSKLWCHKHKPEDVEAALDESLKNLGVGYLDLYLMHWPVAFKPGDDMFPQDENGKIITADIDYIDTYKAMEKLFKTGKTKAIGICNFSLAEVKRLLENTSVVPAAHQMELHPYLQQKSFVEFHKAHNIHVIAYSPFGNQNAIYSSGKKEPKLIEDPVLQEIGKKYGKTSAQVSLAWNIARGVSVIPKSATPERIKQNFEGVFKLDEEDLKKIEKLDKERRFNDSSETFEYNFFTDLEGKQG